MEWVGGYLKVDNSSSGYHKVLLQWAEKHLENTLDQEYDVLIVGEGESAKKNFNEYYPSWNVYTIDRSLEFTHGNVDILGDISDENVLNEKVYDIVLCQSVLEHAFDPVMAMKNMIKSLKDGGVLSVCTHPVGPPGFPYHGSGTCSDYYRFYGDFFLNFIKETGLNAQCVEGFQNDTHIMACYKKLRGI
ncbi:MAG: class I SAM-dependent methyltransferase [Candidatus Hodarchaeales archaeon]|jgi:SAM-dependent methyltransferase